MSIRKLPDGRYRSRIRDVDRRQISKIAPTRSELEDWEAEIRVAIRKGTRKPARAGRVSVRAYAEEHWLPSMRHLRPNSAETYAQHLRTHIYPAWGSRAIGSIDRDDAELLVRELTAKLAPSTVATVHAIAHGLFASAVRRNLIAANSLSGIRLPRVKKRVLEPLPSPAIRDLASVITPRYELVIWLCAGAGLREGEALGLTVPRLDFLHRRLRVVEQLQNGQLVEVKTETSVRTIPVDDVVLLEAASHMEEFPPSPDGLIITNAWGRPVRRSAFGEHWRAAVKEAGLPAGTRVHDLRHWYASTLIAAGLHPKIIQTRLGHVTISETMDVYGHLFPDAAEAGRGAIDAVFAHTEMRESR